jgi:hypothetical protein
MGTDQKSPKTGQMAKAGLKFSDPEVPTRLLIFFQFLNGGELK